MPDTFSCQPGQPVEWGYVQGIMLDLQSLAVELDYTGYQSPVSDSGRVWSTGSKPDVVTVALDLSVSNGVITNALLVSALSSRVPWSLPADYMQQLVTRDALIAILDSDPCLCKTMWRVKEVGRGYTLESTGGLPDGCCPTLQVPAAGDALTPSFFVPTLATRSAPRSTTGWRTVDGCRLGGNAAILYQEGKVVAVQRELRLQLTWTISKWMFDDLEIEMHRVIGEAPDLRLNSKGFPNIPNLFQCSPVIARNSSDGTQPVVPLGFADCVLAKALQAWKAGTVEGVDPPEGAWVSDPGCISAAPVSGYTKWQKPWQEGTCESEPCDDRNRVYCNTFLWLNRVYKLLRAVLCPRRTVDTFDWDTDTLITVSATSSDLHTLTVTKGYSLVVRLDKEAALACGGDTSYYGGSAVTVIVTPVCGARRFLVEFDIPSADKAFGLEVGESCPGPVPFYRYIAEAFVSPLTSGFTWSGYGWRYRAASNVDLCIEHGDPDSVEKSCRVGSADERDGDQLSDIVNGSNHLVIKYGDLTYAETSFSVIITPLYVT